MHPIKTVNIHHSIELSTLCMASICLPTYFQNNISYTRVPILNILMFFWDGDGQTLRNESCGLVTSLFFHGFLPVMAFDHSSMTYKLELLKNRWVHNLLAMQLSAQSYWQWAGPKFHSLLSAHHLIGAYFLTTESDKRMRLLTRLYGITITLLYMRGFLWCE